MTRVFLTRAAGGIRLEEIRTRILNLVRTTEGINSEQIAGQLNLDEVFINALLAELQREGQVQLFM